MTSRKSVRFFVLSALLAGIGLGIGLDRGTAYLGAQVPPRTPSTPAVPPTRPASGEEAIYQQLARQYEQFQHVNRTFELVARAVSPSVVHIVAEKSSRRAGGVHRYEETGSGVIVRGDQGNGLYVLTNNHVVENALPADVNISLQDGRSIRPDRIWLDAKADIAVLNLGRSDLPAARFGNSDEMAVGNWVLALGSPFGLTHSVSQGIISARGRHMDELKEVENQDFLQTDAAINPGNSGGPLVNMKGEIIGINNSIASNGGGNEGVGFSIPINLARWIMNELIEHGRVSRGALGVDLHPEFRPEDAVALGLERPRGAWIDRVRPATPAAEGGLRDGDVVLRYKGVEILDLNHLINMVSMSAIGQPAEVVVWRAGKSVNLTVKVGSLDRTLAQTAPNVERAATKGLLRRPDAAPSAVLGIELTTLNEESARRFQLPEEMKGAAVTKVQPDSPFASVLKPLDVISLIDGRPVQTADEAIKALKQRRDRQPVALTFDRLSRGVIERRTLELP